MDRLTKIYVKEVVRLHKVFVSLVSNRDSKSTSTFYKSLHKAMGIQLIFGMAFHL